MNTNALKDYIFENGLTEKVLESFGCHTIRTQNQKIVCCNPDGDNPNAVNVFLPNLNVVNYTRDLDSVSKYHDILTLAQFYLSLDFPKALEFVCKTVGLSVYHDFEENVPESVSYVRMLARMIDEESEECNEPLKPISENVLSYYKLYVNDMFAQDGISYNVQRLFEIGLDPESNRITIPIRNMDGVLVGVKGRCFYRNVDESESKYIYLVPCSKGQILFGLDKTMGAIRRNGVCYVGESEKFVMQLFSYGDSNCVSTGGKTITPCQIDLLSRLNADIVLCFDQDVTMSELVSISDRFPEGIPVYAALDSTNILKEHESPSDSFKKWQTIKKNIVRIK